MTTLTAGDIAIIGYNSDDPDTFSFVLNRPVTSGTQIFFTDRTWNGSAFSTSGTDGTFTFTAGSSLPAGTVVSVTSAQLTTAGINLDDTGEALYAFQGTNANTPTQFLYAIEFGDGNTTFNASLANTGLTTGTTAVAIATDNAYYAGPATGIEQTQLTAVSNRNSWVQSDTVRQTAESGPLLPPNIEIVTSNTGGSGGSLSEFAVNGAAVSNFATFFAANNFPDNHPAEIVFDTVHGVFFVADSNGSQNEILQGNISDLVTPGAVPTFRVLYSDATFNDGIRDVQLDVNNGQIYFAENHSLDRITYNAANPSASTLNQSPTIIHNFGANFVYEFTLDLTHGHAYVVDSEFQSGFIDANFTIGTVASQNAIWDVTSLTAGAAANEIPFTPADGTLGADQFPSSDGLLSDVAYNSSNNSLVFTTFGINGGNGGVYSYNLTSNPTGTFSTLWSQTSGSTPSATTSPITEITLDPANTNYYITIQNSGTAGVAGVYRGSLSGGTPTEIQAINSDSASLASGAAQATGITLDHQPTLSVTANSGAAATFTEAATNPASASVTRVNPISAATAADIDTTGFAQNLAAATVAVSSDTFFAGDQLTIGNLTSGTFTTAGANIAFSYNSSTGVMSLTGADTFAHYQAALAAIQYGSTSENPTNYGNDQSRTIQFTVSDGLISSDLQTASLTVVGTDDAPVNNGVSGKSGNEDTLIPITGLSVTDVDADPANQNITVSFTVTHGTLTLNTAVANGLTAGEITAGANNSSTFTVTATQNQINATLGSATGLQYQGVLNFNTTTGGSETLTIVSNDQGFNGTGGPLGDSDNLSITVNPVNDSPVLSNVGPNVSVTEQITATLDSNVTVADVDLDPLNGGAGSYTGASLTVARNGGANAQDTYSFDTTSGTPLFSVSGGTLQSGGLTFATFTSSGGTLTLNFTSTGTTATTALVNDAIDRIQYTNTSDDPPASITLNYSFNDGSPGNSQGSGATGIATGSTVVNITPVNDPPTLSATTTAATYTEDAAAVSLFSGANASTVEAGQNLNQFIITVTGLADGSSEILNVDGTDVVLTAGTVTAASTNGFSGSVNAIAGGVQIQFDGAGVTPSVLDTILNGITYRDTGDNPTGGTRTVTITSLMDNGGIANSGADTTALNIASTVNVVPVNDAPVLTAIQPSLNAENEDAPAPVNGQAVGTLVSSIVDLNPPSGGNDNVTDVDSTATGIAITDIGVNGSSIWFSLDNGTTWTQADTNLTDAHALLLAADTNTRVYVQPFANYNGTDAAFTFRAWDQTSGTAGTYADTSINGGTTAFSSTSDNALLLLNPVNDAPTVINGNTTALAAIDEDTTNPSGDTVNNLFNTAPNNHFSDDADDQSQTTATGASDPNLFAGVAVTGNGSNAQGTWQYSTDTGGSWTAVGTVSDASALVLAPDALLRFVPAADYNGPAPTLTTHLIDDSAGTLFGATAGVDVSVTGGTTQYSSATVALGETINPVNDPPVLDLDANDSAATGSDYATLYAGTAVAIADTDVSISDIDSATLASATITITNHQTNDLLSVNGALPGNITASAYNSATGVLTLTSAGATATLAQWQTALNEVVFSNTGPTPNTTTRDVTVVVNDGTADSNIAHTSVTLDQPPTLSVTGAGATFTESATNPASANNTPVTVLSGSNPSDADGGNLAGATISISSGFFAGDVLGFTDTATITGSYDSGTGVLTLTGPDSFTNYQAALNSITYTSTSDNPTNFGPDTSRTISFTVSDGSVSSSPAATATLTVAGTNDAAVVSGVTAVDTAYTEQAAAVAVDSGVTVSDVDSANLAGATVSITGGFTSGDTLHFANQNGISFVSYSGGVLALSGSSSVANYQTALRSVTFDNTTNNDPTATSATRTITWQVDDGAASNNLSNAPTSTITITPVNDAPAIDGTSAVNTSYTEQNPAVAVDAGVTVSDADSTNLVGATVSITAGLQSGDTLHFTDQNGISFVSYTGGVLTLSGSSSVANYQTALASVTFDNTTNDNPTNDGANLTRTVTWQVDDGSGSNNLSNAPTTTITITAVDDAPVNSVPGAQTVNEDTGLVFSSANTNAISTSDPDNASGTEQVTLTVGHGTLTLSQTTGLAFIFGDGTADATMAFTGTVADVNAALNGLSYLGGADYNGPDSLSILTSDNKNTGTGGALSDQDTVAITVNAVNDPPVLSGVGDAGDTPTFVENGSPVLLDANSNASVSDVELDVSSSNYEGATLTLARQGGANPDDVFGSVGSLDLTDVSGTGENVSLDGGATFIGTYTQPGDGSISFTFNANATAADVDSVMRQISYEDTSDNPPASAQIDFTFSDGNGQPGGQDQGSGATPGIATGTITVQITQVDDAPTLSNVALTAAYSPGSPGVVLSPANNIFDPDATPPSPITGIHSATVQIASGFFAGDELFVNLATSGGHFVTPDADTTNISGSYVAGTLTLSGQDTIQHYQQILDAVSYDSTAADPSNGGADPNRTITWQVNDGALNSQTPAPGVNETLLHFDTAPAVDLDGSSPGTGYTTSYTTSTPPVAIVNNDSVTDPDTANADSMTIVLTNAMAGDALSVAGSLPGGITSSIDTSVAGQITLRLTNSASMADYQTALAQVRFANSSASPNTTDRDITVVLSESGGVNSNTAHATVHVIDATPPAKPPAPDLTDASDSGVSHTDNITNVAASTFTGTVEPGTTVRLYDSDGTTVIGTTLADASTGAYTVTSSALSQGTHHLTVTATDASNNTSVHSDALDVTIDTTAPAPTLTRADPATTFRNSTVHYTLSYPETTFGVDASDFTLTQSGGASGAAITGVTEPGGLGTPYAISVSTGTGLGTIEVDLRSSGTGISDTAGNLSGGATGPVYTIVNRAPVAHNDSVTLAASQTVLTGNLLANDTDADGDPLRVTSLIDYRNGVQQQVAVPSSGSVTLQSSHGAFTVSADGSYTYTANDTRPVQGHYAEDPLAYSISDGHGGTAGAQLQVNLAGQTRPSTETFNFNFVNATVSYGSDGQAYLTGPDGVTHNVTGVNTLVFNDGRIDEGDYNQRTTVGPPPGTSVPAGSALVDDLYYDSQYHDVYLAGIDPEQHYAQFGWHEGRNPDPYFNTNYYLSHNPDVAAAGINPLTHYDTSGWREGRDPSANFDTRDYQLAYPDVAAAGIDPLAHYLQFGELENRLTFPVDAGLNGPIDGFDPNYYLANNPDVAAAHINPFQHYLQYGWHEGRNPSADFNTNFYEAHNPDVAAAGIDPLIHYDQYGWHENRDPSAVFSTSGYLNTYFDVAAANINPLQHYLQYGMAEGRSPTG